uniref:Putative secreted protein n=1 Tax=Anopheles darlingi TaxID=43151 RepID=A0A2M4D6U9_ANODA
MARVWLGCVPSLGHHLAMFAFLRLALPFDTRAMASSMGGILGLRTPIMFGCHAAMYMLRSFPDQTACALSYAVLQHAASFTFQHHRRAEDIKRGRVLQSAR